MFDSKDLILQTFYKATSTWNIRLLDGCPCDLTESCFRFFSTRPKHQLKNIVLFVSNTQFGCRLHMLPLPKKWDFKCQIFLIKSSTCTSSQYMCVRQVSRKTFHFCALCKKEKKNLVKILIFGTDFFLFYTLQQVDFSWNNFASV
jgi:hypothetical protein